MRHLRPPKLFKGKDRFFSPFLPLSLLHQAQCLEHRKGLLSAWRTGLDSTLIALDHKGFFGKGEIWMAQNTQETQMHQGIHSQATQLHELSIVRSKEAFSLQE